MLLTVAALAAAVAFAARRRRRARAPRCAASSTRPSSSTTSHAVDRRARAAPTRLQGVRAPVHEPLPRARRSRGTSTLHSREVGLDPDAARPAVVFHVMHTRSARGRAPAWAKRGRTELARAGTWIVTGDCELRERRAPPPPAACATRAGAIRARDRRASRRLVAVAGVVALMVVSLLPAHAARSTPRSGSTRASRSGSPPTASPTSPACSSRTARRRSTTCCSTSGCRSSATRRSATHGLSVVLRGPHRARRRSGPGAACRDARTGLARRRARRDQPVPDVLRAGDADVRARRAARHGGGRGASCTCSPAATAATCRCSSIALALLVYTPQLGAVPRRPRRSSRWSGCGATAPPDERRPLAARRPHRLRRRRGRCTCRGCRRCSSRPSTPARRGPSGRASTRCSPRSAILLGGATTAIALAARRRQRGGRTLIRDASPRRPPRRSTLLVADGRRRSRSRGWPRRSRPPSRTATSPCSSGRCCCSPRAGLAHAGRLGLVCFVARRPVLVRPADRRSSRRRATSGRSPQSIARRWSPPATSSSPRTPSSSRVLAYYLPDGVPLRRPRWARWRTRGSWTGATRWTGCEAAKPGADRARRGRPPRAGAGARPRPADPAHRAVGRAVDVARPQARRAVGAQARRATPACARGRRPGVRLRPPAEGRAGGHLPPPGRTPVSQR